MYLNLFLNVTNKCLKPNTKVVLCQAVSSDAVISGAGSFTSTHLFSPQLRMFDQTHVCKEACVHV